MITVNPAINYKNSNQSEYIRDSVLKIHIDILCVHSSFEGTKRPKFTFLLFENKVLSGFN